MKLRNNTFFVFCLFVSSIVCGQTGYRFRNYSITNGLSQSSVTTIQQDFSNGLWVGTQDGLNRFDGYNFEVFNAEDTEGLESGFITCSDKSEDGKIWFGTTNGLTVFDPLMEKFSTYDLGSGLPLKVEDIFIDKYNKVWIASSTHGIQIFNTVLNKFEGIKRNASLTKAQELYVYSSTEVLVFTFDEGLQLWNPFTNQLEKIRFPETDDFVTVNNIVEVTPDHIFLATDQGVYRYMPESKSLEVAFQNLKEEFGDVNITDIFTEEGIWYLASGNQGLFTVRNDGSIFNSSQDVFQKYALLFNEINVLFKDKTGTFWVGTQRGLSNFDPNNQGFYSVGPVADLQQGLPNSSVWSFGEDPGEKYFFIGTDNALSRYNRETSRFEHFFRIEKEVSRIEKKETSIFCLYVINPQRVLVGCVDGLYELRINGPKDYTYQLIYKSDENSAQLSWIYSIAYWKEQKFFLGTRGGVVLVDVNNGDKQVFENDPKRRSKTIVAGVCRFAFKDKNNKMWFATSGGGLNYLKEENGELLIVPYERNDILAKYSKDFITSILHKSTNEYWLATVGSGVLKHNVKNRKTDVYDKSKGLPNNLVYGVLSDRDGFVWMSTNKGLCRLDPKTGETRNYTEVDGLMSNEMNLGAYYRSISGSLYFGGIYGYNFFDPRSLTYFKREVEVLFSKFKLDQDWLIPGQNKGLMDKTMSLMKNLTLNYKQRSFTLRFQSTDMSNPELIQYKYLLEGSDEGEIYLGTSNELRFNALNYGKYILKVYARKGQGEWSKRPATLKIEVTPPFWLSWWFFLICSVVFIITIAMYIRFRLDAERREQVRLEMKIQARTKEIRAQNKKIEKQRYQLEEERNKVLEQQRLLQIEKDKSEKLLNNIIPSDTVDELKKKGKASARAYKKVTVLFTDFVGFTKIADAMNASELVEKLDFFFTKFDEIIELNNLEKIKTIGDAYMAAGGVPVRNNTNAIESCLAGLQIQSFISKTNKDAAKKGETLWKLRLGINTGEVTAGVIGSKRFAYDVWGVTVNQAQRMEMLSQPGKVTITGNTYKDIIPYFETVYKGKVKSKSRGLIDMYVVDGIKPELSVNGEGVFPNEKFRQIFDLHMFSSINYYKAEKHIIKVLEEGLDESLHYHCIAHTKDVVRAAESIAIQEGVTDEGLYLLKSAATYHDAGFVTEYDKNEHIGAKMAEEILPSYGYTKDQIAIVKEMIYVTEIPHKPKNVLEQIICDADLDYLGRADFHEIADKLRIELREHGKIDSDRAWDNIQVGFLTQHKYFTATSKRLRDEKKAQNLEEIKKRIEEDNYKD
ncbi:MAG: ligand-binding sensor domain-containing protein/class 3 adenylate cyclase [Lentimonas sp.]